MLYSELSQDVTRRAKENRDADRLRAGGFFAPFKSQNVTEIERAEDRKVIYCEGVEQGSSLHNAFAGSAAPYKERYCCARWEDCRIAKMLWNKYE